MARRVDARGKWKNVEIDLKMFNETTLMQFSCMKELTDYEIVGGDSPRIIDKSKKSGKLVEKNPKKVTAKKGKKQRQQQQDVTSEENENTGEDSMVEKKGKKRKQDWIREEDQESDEDSTAVTSLKKLKKQKITQDVGHKGLQKKKNENETPSAAATNEIKKSSDMTAWSALYVPEPVLRRLDELGFRAPTPIQSLTLPFAIRDKQDIIGAAETGSGKTLSFAIPMIHHILKDKEDRQSRRQDRQAGRDNITADDEGDHESGDDGEQMNLGSDGEGDEEEGGTSSEEEEEEEKEILEGGNISDEEDNPVDEDDVSSDVDQSVTSESGGSDDDEAGEENNLCGLILSPTRELAMQVCDHIKAITKYTSIRCLAVIGGLTELRQTRLLKKRPEIVVATPGRLWDLIQKGDIHLNTIGSIRYLVIDEADRMVEKNHFEAMSHILELINSNVEMRSKRQTFVFSATLTFVHVKPHWLNTKNKKKKKAHQITSQEKIEELASRIGFRAKPKTIDLTVKGGTVSTLTEARINCALEEKDWYLYYFLSKYPGRTIVFCNSKDCVRRLVSILNILKCAPIPLHADIHQGQRLKNLDRFKANAYGLLLATDVAARGLDIPDIQHVIHYQVPQTTENYIHRSGRTARAQKEGISVMLIGPDDIRNYNKIIKSLKRDAELPVFPVKVEFLAEVKARVNLARQLDKYKHSMLKTKKDKSWIVQAALEADIELDEDQFGSDEEDSQQRANEERQMAAVQYKLTDLLSHSLDRTRSTSKYPTKTGKLNVSSSSLRGSEGSAVGAVRNEKRKENKEEETKETKDNASSKKNKRRRNNRFFNSKNSGETN